MPYFSARRVNEELLLTGQSLVARHDTLPAGAVLRCFARSVRTAHREGCATADLAARAETLASTALAGRRATAGSTSPR